jgi:hypothetical protein
LNFGHASGLPLWAHLDGGSSSIVSFAVTLAGMLHSEHVANTKTILTPGCPPLVARHAALECMSPLFPDGSAVVIEKGRVTFHRECGGHGHAASGMSCSEHLEGDGAAMFAPVCKLGFEGIVSKHREHPYRSGPSKAWLKVKNPAAPGVLRFQDRT